MELLDAEGTPQTAYIPGETYTLRVSIANADDAMAYGFQAVVLDTAATTDLGTYGATSDGAQTSPFGQRTYFEHSTPLQEPLAEVEWTAPAAGAGDIVVYAAGNAVNGNRSISGDNVDLVEVRFAEATSGGADTTATDTIATDTTSAIALIAAEDWAVAQVDEQTLRVSLPEGIDGAAAVDVVDVAGRCLASVEHALGTVDVALPEVTALVVVRIATPDGRVGVRKVALRR